MRKRSKKIDASRHTVSVGDSVPRFAAIAPKKPAVRMPAKVAQFSPSGPGVISAMATISETSAAVIQPWEVISEVISGIIERPPKLVKPIFRKLMNSSSSTIMFLRSLPLVELRNQQAADRADDAPDRRS